MKRRRVNIRKHKRKLKSGKQTIVKKHYRKLKSRPIYIYDPLIKVTEKPRICWKCGKALNYEEMCEANRGLPEEYLERIWLNEDVELYCCSCHRGELNKSVSLPEYYNTDIFYFPKLGQDEDIISLLDSIRYNASKYHGYTDQELIRKILINAYKRYPLSSRFKKELKALPERPIIIPGHFWYDELLMYPIDKFDFINLNNTSIYYRPKEHDLDINEIITKFIKEEYDKLGGK